MFFKKKTGPVFVKEYSDAENFIKNMEGLKSKASGKLQEEIESQIKLARYGEIGENNIAFELKNSGMDMYILRDIYLEKDNLSAQIDYIVITRKHLYVIECKNLIGNIEIDSTGAFIRSYELFGRKIKEGIYSPITQNQRHLQVLKEVRKESKSNFLSKMLYEKNFGIAHKSIVVLANPKTCLNAKYAKKDVKEQVIRADKLISYIKETDEREKDYSWNHDEMLELAQFYLRKNKAERSDYAKKYQDMLEQIEKERKVENIREEVQSQEDVSQNTAEFSERNRELLVKQLKKFRLEQSRKEGIKPYYIFNDAQMEDLLKKTPQSKVDLLKVSGFGDVKVDKYGDEILRILMNAALY